MNEAKKTFFLVIHNCAIELIPPKILKHPSIIKSKQKRNKNLSETILDRSIHGKAIEVLKDAHQRGRPDILHSTLQQIMFSAFYKLNRLLVYVHLRNDWVFRIPFDWRPPVNYNRFIPLFEQLLVNHQVPAKGAPILRLTHMTLPTLVKQISPSKCYYFTHQGTKKFSLYDLAHIIHKNDRSAILIGGFQAGSAKSNHSWEFVALGENSLPTCVIVAKILTALELIEEN